ncbi:hypothetical protein, partial [Streptomyces sp. NPDC058964]|uniref:hypothetical protein n=1 Tax=Streptomyces sp. NPDC058964 TaxID=3346681 RepID=UPI00369AC3A4
ASGKAGKDTGDASAEPAPAAAVPQDPGSTASAEPSGAKSLQVADGYEGEDKETGGAPDGRTSAPAGEAGSGSGEPGQSAPPARAAATAAMDSPVRRTGAVQPEPVDKSAAERDDTRAPARQETASGTDQDPDDAPLGLEQGGAAEALADLEDLLDEAEEDVGTEPETGPPAEDTPLPPADSETAAVGSGTPGRASTTDTDTESEVRGSREPRVTAEGADDLASLLEVDSPQEDTADDPPDTANDPADQQLGPDPESGTADGPGPAADPGSATEDERADRADRAEDRDLASETRRANERQGGDESDAAQAEA